jgi:hypothetical protein
VAEILTKKITEKDRQECHHRDRVGKVHR